MANRELVPEGRYIPMALPELGITAHWVVSPETGGAYLAVRAQCDELGIAPNSQLQKLEADDTYNPPDVLCPFKIETAGGRQVAMCLRKAEAALWLGTINPRKVKPVLSGKMADVRARILHAADRIVFGDMTNALTVSSTPARGGDVDVGGCPLCHAHLGLHVGQDGLGLYPWPTKEE